MAYTDQYHCLKFKSNPLENLQCYFVAVWQLFPFVHLPPVHAVKLQLDETVHDLKIVVHYLNTLHLLSFDAFFVVDFC